MTFSESIRTCFAKYATFSGRARRSEFWWFALFLAIADLGLSLVADILSGLWNLATVLPYAAVAWRRLHDIDRTGLWTLVPLIPLVGAGLMFSIEAVTFIGLRTSDLFWVFVAITVISCILNIVFWVSKSTDGPNRFGEHPLA